MVATCSHLQYAGEVGSDALHQHAVGPQLGALPAGDVAVALADQHSHLLHGGARVHVVTQSLMDGRLPVVETGRNK